MERFSSKSSEFPTCRNKLHNVSTSLLSAASGLTLGQEEARRRYRAVFCAVEGHGAGRRTLAGYRLTPHRPAMVGLLGFSASLLLLYSEKYLKPHCLP